MDAAYFYEYQLLGASNMVRFCSNILQIEPVKNEAGCAQVGFCVSGQGIRQLTRRISRRPKDVAEKLIICIGTNDVKNLVSLRRFKLCLRSLRRLIQNKEVLWLTIPPLPRFENYPLHMVKLKQFNHEIRKLAGGNIKVLDLHQLFIAEDNKIMKTYFEQFYIRPRNLRHLGRKRDEIHFNTRGLQKIARWLQNEIRP